MTAEMLRAAVPAGPPIVALGIVAPGNRPPGNAQPGRAQAGRAQPGNAQPGNRRRGPRSWRWLRLATPFAVLGTVVIISAIAYVLQQPSPTDQAYLSPRSTAGIGASRLAGLLADKGVIIQRELHSSDALVAAYQGNATLLLPAPALMHPFYLRMLKLLPESTRVVIVAPGSRVAANGLIPLTAVGERIAAKAVPPDCAFPPAAAAGDAAVARLHFSAVDPDAATPMYRCYGGSLVGYRRGAAEITVIGAADVFRNDRIGEYGNAALAVGLLSRAPRVIWLDLHRSEPRPGVVNNSAQANAPPAPPSLGVSGSPDPDFPLPSGSENAFDPNPPGGGGGGGSGNPLWSAFPPWAFATAALIGVAALLFALARGRRLAAPVPEPLPVAVRATETVDGRGRLYQRARARSSTLSTLQSAARVRLTRLLDLPADAPASALVPAVLAQSAVAGAGWAAGDVAATLYPPDPPDPDLPADDRTLVQAATALDTLLHLVMRRSAPEPARPDGAAPEGDSR